MDVCGMVRPQPADRDQPVAQEAERNRATEDGADGVGNRGFEYGSEDGREKDHQQAGDDAALVAVGHWMVGQSLPVTP